MGKRISNQPVPEAVKEQLERVKETADKVNVSEEKQLVAMHKPSESNKQPVTEPLKPLKAAPTSRKRKALTHEIKIGAAPQKSDASKAVKL